MRKIFLSFLGLGSFNNKTETYEYHKAIYELGGKASKETEFVQVAEMQLLGADGFDRLFIVATQKSHDAHFSELETQLKDVGVADILPVIINEEMSADSQWIWFEKILDHIEPKDQLVVDLTHGYRPIPIVFSTAVNFLQKARDIELIAVYYGAYDQKNDSGQVPIVDMKDFYIINEWAEAVSRLVEDADARKMAEVSDMTADFQAGELNDQAVIQAFADLTNTIRNVDIHGVADKANAAVGLIEEKRRTASITGRILLNLVIDKFVSLSAQKPPSGRYDKAYFLLQLEIIKLLLEHKLFMQAYTVMREFIASVGLIEIKKAKTGTSKGRDQRFKGDVFVNMFQHPEARWEFNTKTSRVKERLMPYYEKLKVVGVEQILRDFAKDLVDYRNGFDHAWTTKAGMPNDIEKKGYNFAEKLDQVVHLLEKNGILE